MYNMYFSKNNTPYKNIVYFEKILIIETYLIGYKTEGEAILFFIRTDGKISFSGLVDCFYLAEVDKIKEILDKNNVEKLDFICWTHPDFDHSKGLKNVIDEYTSQKTMIWIPEGIDTKEINCSEEVKKLFECLKECTTNIHAEYNVYSVSDKKDMMYYNSFCFQKDVARYPLEITSYTPNSNIIRKQNYMERFIKNDRSIFFVLALGDVRIFLTGDVEDGTLEKIPSNYFYDNVHIIKIPHHGSDSSVKMLDLGWDECDVAFSTVYRKGNNDLPILNVMEQYNKRVKHLMCTGKKVQNQESEKYGIIKIETDVVNNKYSIQKEGNAEYWESASDLEKESNS